MNIRKLNESFKKQYGIVTESVENDLPISVELKQALKDAANELQANFVTNIKNYEIKFQEVIENLFPDKSWWEVTDCEIFFDLFQNRDIDGCINRIIDGLKSEFKDNELTEKSLTESDTIKIHNDSKNKEIKIDDKSEVGDIGHPIKQGLGDPTNKTLEEQLTECLNRLTEASISPEDKKDSDIIRNMLAKIETRSNAKFTPEEQAIMKKYNIQRDNYRKNLTVGPNNIPIDRSIDHTRGGGTPSKINYADRARKTSDRDKNQIYAPTQFSTRNDDINYHNNWMSNYQDAERDHQNAVLQEPVNDMKRSLKDRKWNKNYIDNAQITYDNAIAKAKAEYEKAVKEAEWTKENSTTGYHKTEYDRAQNRIDNLLKRNKQEESLQEATNPANEEVNKLIRDIVNGDSRAYSKLRKLGYEVEIDDSARKEFGSRYFGKSIRIINTKTGRQIYADVGNQFKSDDSIIAKPVKDTSIDNPDQYKRNFHKVKPGKYSGSQKPDADAKSFDYKGYLDKPIYDDAEPKSTLQQFKDDRRFVKEYDSIIKRGNEAQSRLDTLRAKMKHESLNEWTEFDADEIMLYLKKEYDEIVDTTVAFDEDVADFVERLCVYQDVCKKFFNIDPQSIFVAGMKHCAANDSYTLDFSDFVKGALYEVVEAYINVFSDIYNQHKGE